MPPGAPFREGAGEVRLSFGYVSLSATTVGGGVLRKRVGEGPERVGAC